MIFLFWNIRDVDSIYNFESSIAFPLSIENYDLYKMYIEKRNDLYNFCNATSFYYAAPNLPFIYTNKTLFPPYIMAMFHFKLLTKTTLEVEHVVKITPKELHPLYKTYNKIVKTAVGHDGRRTNIEYYDVIKKKFKYVEYWTTFSSSLENKFFLTPLGAQFVAKHNNNKMGDLTMEVPLCSFEGDSAEDLNKNIKNIIQE